MSDPQPRLVRVAGRGDTYFIYHERRRISTGTPIRADAQAALASYIAGLTAPRADRPALIADILARYLDTRAGKPGHERLSWAHRPLCRLIGERVPADSVADYAPRRAAEGVASTTVRTELQALRAALRWHLGAEHAPTLVLPPKAPPRERWLRPAEAVKLLDAADAPHVKLFIQIGLHTGARRTAILELTWDRVDLDQRRIDFRAPGTTQTRKRRVPVPINDTLLAALRDAEARRMTPHVIEWAGGPVASVKNGFAAACRRAGLDDVTPHTLRHTAATWLAQRGVKLWDIAGILGHSDVSMVAQVYGHHCPDYLQSAVSALG